MFYISVKYNDLPYISVAIPEYDASETDKLSECIKSLLNQDYPRYEIVVISESDEVSEFVRNEFGNESIVSVKDIENPDGGVSVARNAAVHATGGEVIAYIDSDAVADEDWLNKLGVMYRDKNVLAVGGRAEPDWIGKRPKYLPDEFLWLVGVTHKGHPKNGSIVRSTFGCNMSYRRSVLEELRFNDNLGKEHGYNLQGEEPELGIRMREEFNSGMYYAGDARIYHKIDEEQTSLKWLTRRAYLQGISKAIIENETREEDSLGTDKSFLGFIFKNSLPNYSRGLVYGPRIASVYLLFGILYFTVLVGMGYTVGKIKTFSL